MRRDGGVGSSTGLAVGIDVVVHVAIGVLVGIGAFLCASGVVVLLAGTLSIRNSPRRCSPSRDGPRGGVEWRPATALRMRR